MFYAKWHQLSPIDYFRCNYSIVLIVSKLRFKSTKPDFAGFIPPNLTVPALSKHPSLLTTKLAIFAYSSKPFCLKMGDGDKNSKIFLGDSVILWVCNLGDSVKIIIFALENKFVYDFQEETI